MSSIEDSAAVEFRRQVKRHNREKLLGPLLMPIIYHFVNWQAALIVGLCMCIYVLIDILIELKCSNLLRSKQVGSHFS